MSINYYISGFNYEEGFPTELGNRLNLDIKETKSIVFIPATNNEDKMTKYKEIIIPGTLNFFNKVGITFEETYLVTADMNNDQVQDLVSKSDLIFLLGGNPFIQMDFIKEKGLYDIISNYNNVIMGTSAGAMIMSKNIIITPCSEEYPNYDIREGFNLNNISVFPHVNVESEIPDILDLGKEKIKKEDLLRVSKEYGNYYLLQDEPTVSYIRAEGNNIELMGGTIFEAKDGVIDIVDSFIERQI